VTFKEPEPVKTIGLALLTTVNFECNGQFETFEVMYVAKSVIVNKNWLLSIGT
jgi:hypothetical protein